MVTKAKKGCRLHWGCVKRLETSGCGVALIIGAGSRGGETSESGRDVAPVAERCAGLKRVGGFNSIRVKNETFRPKGCI